MLWQLVPLWFQSTYLYKVRPSQTRESLHEHKFQSTYLYKVRHNRRAYPKPIKCFNPRTYIRYDNRQNLHSAFFRFQSTYLYKVRQLSLALRKAMCRFQSTYLYKVRLMPMMFPIQTKMFQSTYLYKVRLPRRD